MQRFKTYPKTQQGTRKTLYAEYYGDLHKILG